MREVLVKYEEFKDSPVGKIPKDWETVTLKDEINLLHGYAFEGKYFSDRPPGEVLLVPGNFHREGGLYFDENNTKYYQGAIPNNTVLNNGDLLIVMTDLSPRTLILGRIVQLELPFKVLHNQRIGKIIPKLPDTWDKRFLMLVMNSDRVRRNIISNATGTTVRHTSPDRIIANVVPKPNRQEQSKIAEILDTVDEAIARTSSLIIKLKQTKAGLLQDLLTRGLDDDGKLRDPHAHPEQFKDSPLGQIPKEWEAKYLGQVLINIDAGKSPNCPDIPATGKEWGVLKISAVNPNGFKAEENKVITNPIFSNPNYEVKDSDLLITRSNTYELVGLTCLVKNPPPQLLLCDKTLRLNVDTDKAEVEFISYVLQMPYLRSQIQINATGSSAGMKNITQDIIKNLLLALPKDVNEQKSIANLLNLYGCRIYKEEAYLNKLKLQKQGLMQDLLTGKMRVKNL